MSKTCPVQCATPCTNKALERRRCAKHRTPFFGVFCVFCATSAPFLGLRDAGKGPRLAHSKSCRNRETSAGRRPCSYHRLRRGTRASNRTRTTGWDDDDVSIITLPSAERDKDVTQETRSAREARRLGFDCPGPQSKWIVEAASTISPNRTHSSKRALLSL